MNSLTRRVSAVCLALVGWVAACCLICDSVSGQQISTNPGGGFGAGIGGATGGGAAGAGAGGAQTGTGTAGAGGLRGGVGGTGLAGIGGIGGSGITTAPAGFVGGNMAQDFIGATRQAVTNTNDNRQFRAIRDTTQRSTAGMRQTGTPRQVPMNLQLGFTTPSFASSAGNLAPTNAPSFQQFSETRPELTRLQVQVSADGIATLTGTTNSMETRRLAANLIRFQPGIRSVDNQLQVESE